MQGVVEALGAVAVLWTRGSAWLLPAAFLSWLAVVGLASSTLWQALAHLIAARLKLSQELIEKLVGHRTRAVQERVEGRHGDEDLRVSAYANQARVVDGRWVWLREVAPRGWLVIGLLVCTATFVDVGDATAALVALGGILLGWEALSRWAAGIPDLAEAAFAWRQAGASRTRSLQKSASLLSSDGSGSRAGGEVLLKGEEISFSYPLRSAPVLSDCRFTIYRGDRIWLQGSSGNGKSTLASIICGLRFPQEGLILLDGLDPSTLGVDRWRRRIVAAPQFHENHVFAETLAFNLLMGRRWPPSDADLALAETVCRELDLGPLLERMPAGLFQLVGDAGWQLSHGERNRVYVARALLQSPELLVLDESFSALDPETFAQCLDTIVRRAPSILLIAHR